MTQRIREAYKMLRRGAHAVVLLRAASVQCRRHLLPYLLSCALSLYTPCSLCFKFNRTARNINLPKAGTVLYVTPDGAGKRDGSSWGNAIAGNTVYQLPDIEGPGLATGDQLDAANNRVLDSAGNPILTTNEKYCGGFAKSWFTNKTTGGTTTTTVTETWTTEENIYVGGDRNGEVETVQDGTVPTETINTVVNSEGSAEDGFVAGYGYDSRYPYGELSSASRSFWRANPYHNGTDWNNAADYDMAGFIAACNVNGWINNAHEEKYVSGLQYAVEMASAYNKTGSTLPRIEGVSAVQVWVSNGKYTDYKGYVMRDNTKVMGAFPSREGWKHQDTGTG